MQRGTDVIAPMRNIGEDSLVEGAEIQIDVAGPWEVFLYPKQVGAATTRSKKRSKVKQWVLLCVDMFSHRLECATLDSMSTDSLQSGLKECVGANGWSTRKISLDPGSSLLPAVHRTARHIQEDEDEHGEAEGDVALPDEEVPPKEAAALLDGLRSAGWVVRTPWSTSSSPVYRSLVTLWKYERRPPGALLALGCTWHCRPMGGQLLLQGPAGS